VEEGAHNAEVGGSSPPIATIQINDLRQLKFNIPFSEAHPGPSRLRLLSKHPLSIHTN